MGTTENKALVRRLIDMTFNEGNFGPEMDEIVSQDYVEYLVGPIQGVTDRDGYKAIVTELRAAFTNMDFRVEEMIAEGPFVSSRNQWEADHTAEFRGIPPTGKRVKVTAMGFSRIDGGKVVEHWGQVDMLGLMFQLGMMGSPPPSSPPGSGGELRPA
ncbi:MAG TPA: ester cyclase [Acidimicrobiales bacterium]|jgi:predicted ester cyclase|nr:ester cyclase [Acidimicrobiales bacterium]